jgi:hypothetical protein
LSLRNLYRMSSQWYIHQTDHLTCTVEPGIPGSTQMEVVGADRNPLHKRPLEREHQSRSQLILAAL